MYSLLKINTGPGWVWNSCKYLANRPDVDVHVLQAAIVPDHPALAGMLLRYKWIFTSIGIHLDNTNMLFLIITQTYSLSRCTSTGDFGVLWFLADLTDVVEPLEYTCVTWPPSPNVPARRTRHHVAYTLAEHIILTHDGHCYCSGTNRSRLFGSLSECSHWLQHQLSEALGYLH